MDARERVITALAFEKPDRLPRYEVFRGGFIEKWRASRGLAPSADVYDHYAKIDIGTVLRPDEGPLLRTKGIESRHGDAYYERDGWGRLLKRREGAYFFQEVEVALKDKSDLDGLVFDPPELWERYEGIRETRARCERRFAPVSGVLGLFMCCCRLRGTVQFLMDLAADVPFCRDLVARVAEFVGRMGGRTLDETGTRDTALWVYDELAETTSSLISPRVFEEVFLPAYKQMIAGWKSDGLSNVILHCDGNCLSLIEMLLDAGFTGIQGIAPKTGMVLPEMKREYGDRLILIGGMCNIIVLPEGSREDIEGQARAIVDVARDGGVVIGTHSVDGDIPVESYDLYYSVLDECDAAW